MTHSTRVPVIVAATLAEGIWMVLLARIVGVLAGSHTAPIGALAIVVLPLAAGWAPTALPRWATRSVALAAVWIVLALDPTGPESHWLLHAPWRAGGALGITEGFDAVAGLVAGVWLWARGIARWQDRDLHRGAAKSFRMGLWVVALALVLDASGVPGLAPEVLLAPFFALSLATLAAARLPPPSRRGRRTGSVAAGGLFVVATLASVLAIGGYHLLGALLTGARVVLVEVAGAVRSVAQGALDALQAGLESGAFDDEVDLPADPGTDWSGMLVLSADAFAVLLQILLVAAAVGLGYLAFRVLANRTVVPAGLEVGALTERRERLRPADPARALLHLLGALLGRGRGRSGPRNGALPADTDVADACRLYLAMLDAAADAGLDARASLTPYERVPSLSRMLPGAPVAAITECFVRALYGATPTPREHLAQLATALHETLEGR